LIFLKTWRTEKKDENLIDLNFVKNGITKEKTGEIWYSSRTHFIHKTQKQG